MGGADNRTARRAGAIQTMTDAPPLLIGWREHVGLPELGLPRVSAKIDTGARTSALHASRIVRFDKAGEPWVRFRVPHSGLHVTPVCEAPLVDHRAITNTSGVPDTRLVISTLLILGGRRWRIEVSLADRTAMSLPIILGRTAFRRRGVLVDAGRSWLAGEPGLRTAKVRKTPAESPKNSPGVAALRRATGADSPQRTKD